MAELLSALGLDAEGNQIAAGTPPTGPLTSQNQTPTLGAVSKDHTVAPGNPVQTMTNEIRQWCNDNKACRRCRVKNATHRSADCPRYKNVPDRPGFVRSVAGIAEEEESGNG
eukprot:499509-Rhodomonas_salina.1